MADALKDSYGRAVPDTIAAMISGAWPAFPAKDFLKDVLQDYDDLVLMARGRHIADALRRHLPEDFKQAGEILMASLQTRVKKGETLGSFLYLPHTMFFARHGLAHFDQSMAAQYQLTQLFTAEFSVRSFFEHHPERTLKLFKKWARDPNEHVRRLVSEGSRPRLPWAQRLRAFQRDPQPVLELLELLKDDPALYVRRSVANNLNDIGKDHPEILNEIARRWLVDAPPERLWLVRHALRSAVKRGEGGALDAMGYGAAAKVDISEVEITPARASIGGKITFSFALTNPAKKPQNLLVDFQIHYIKANGKPSAKIFKLKELLLAPGETRQISKSVSLKEMTTRKHYPGTHQLDLLINGVAHSIGAFELT